MAYKALYRKYRPDSFDSVVGQTAIVKTLQNIVKKDKISHAYLFSGPRGTGKTSVAKIFAKAINCISPKDGMPCGECAICKQISEDNTSDILEIDAASNNGVDEIRDLKSKINLVPTMCKYKVYIIDEVHMLSIGAFNALLKTLEEPPHHVVFILATTEMHKLPLTIISRCQNYNFKKITEEQMKMRLNYIALKEEIEIDDDSLYEIAKVCDGGMRDAIGLLEQLSSFTNSRITMKDVELLSSSVPRKDIANVIEKVIDCDVEGIFRYIDKFYQEGKDFTKIAEDMIIFLKDVLVYRKAESYFKESNSYNMDYYMLTIGKLNNDLPYKFISEINRMISELKISSHPKIIFEITLLKLIDSNPVYSGEPAIRNQKENSSEKKTVILVADESKHEIAATEKNITLAINNGEAEEKVIYEDILPFIKIPLYKKILINNTLAVAEKELLKDLKVKCDQLKTFLLNKDFKIAATVLLDGNIVGASNDSIIYAYPYDAMVEKADETLEEIELLINNIAGRKFKITNIMEDTWSEIRPYYINLMKEKKKINILPEIDMKAIKDKTKTKKKSKEFEDAINMFGEDLIEIK